MSDLFTLFINNLLPVFLASGAGFLLARTFKLNSRPLSQTIFYIFSPCLIFNVLTQNHLGNSDTLRGILFAGFVMFIVGLLTWFVAKSLKLDRSMTAGVLLTSVFMNAGNYGLPVVLFAFGETALGFASVYFVTMAILVYTAGVFIASMGSTSIKESLANLVKLPLIYALVLAFFIMYTGWQIPLFLDRTIKLLGDASIPAMLVLLGMQLSNVRFAGITVPMLLSIVMRLLVSPVIAFTLASLLRFPEPARQASVLIAAMPSAVFNTVLATEYDVQPSFVTAVVFVTTIISPLTITPLLALMGA